MKSIRVSLKERSYNIAFGRLERDLPKQSYSRILVVTSKAVKEAGHANKLLKSLRKQCDHLSLVVIPNGEEHKTLKTVAQLYKAGLKAGLDRKSAVVGLGGGVVTDVAGFFAATYMRGLPFVSIPTTLLGMVDAAIGGKTGVDLPQGKNLVGAFWQPKLVFIDPRVLKTLPLREWRTGFAEVIKYGVIKDVSFFNWLQVKLRRNSDVRSWSSADLLRSIHTSAQIKARVVSADEREAPLGGGREILNFGHTVGHALEAATSYQALSHGEAISIGMAAAGLMAIALKTWGPSEQLEMVWTLDALHLPTRVRRSYHVNKPKFWAALKSDKKNVAGQLRFVLPVRIGKVKVQSGIPVSLVRQVMYKLGL